MEFVVQALVSIPLKLLQYVETFEFMEPDNGTMRLVKRDQKFSFAAWLGEPNSLQFGVTKFNKFRRLDYVCSIARI